MAGNEAFSVEHTFSPFSAGYIRFRSIKPDGLNSDGTYQKGVQMAIAELEVYKQ